MAVEFRNRLELNWGLNYLHSGLELSYAYDLTTFLLTKLDIPALVSNQHQPAGETMPENQEQRGVEAYSSHVGWARCKH
jgi:hypothetical protein